MQQNKTGVLNDSRMLKHRSKKGHPQKPRRVEQIMKRLKKSGLLQHPRIDYIPSYDREVTDEEIKLVYPTKYVNYLKNLWPKDSHRHDITVLDTYFCMHSEQAARLSAGGVLLGIDKVMNGEWKNGFAVVRPPGHHSGSKNTLNGFCILNGVAIGTRYIQQKYNKKKITILDWDVHRGDGTHHIFESDPDVLFISVHRYDHAIFYPAGQQGNFDNCGTKEGKGSKINIPLNHLDKNLIEYDCQSPGDNEYIYLFNRIIEPIIKEFNPDFILVSSGFDASRFDPLGDCTVTPNGFFYMAHRLAELNLPLLAVLQGGYNIQQTSLDCEAAIRGLLEQEVLPQPQEHFNYQNIAEKCSLNELYHQDLDQIIQHHSQYWKSLQSEHLIKYTLRIKSNLKPCFGVFKNSEESSSESEDDEQTKPQVIKEMEKNQKQKKKEEDPHEKLIEQLKKVNNTQLKQETVEQQDSDGSNQFYFAVGHMQRFKNFNVHNKTIMKWAYPSELNFYESKSPESQFAPKYFGNQGEYVILQNLLYELQDHVIADLKVSRHSKKPGISETRKKKQLKKEEHSTSGKYAFRLCGFTTPTYKQGGILTKDQMFLRKIFSTIITKDNKDQFCTFLLNLSQTLRKVNRKYYNTSLLMIKGKNKSTIKWIDFHYWNDNNETYDEDLVQGLDNIRKFIQEVEVSTDQ